MPNYLRSYLLSIAIGFEAFGTSENGPSRESGDEPPAWRCQVPPSYGDLWTTGGVAAQPFPLRSLPGQSPPHAALLRLEAGTLSVPQKMVSSCCLIQVPLRGADIHGSRTQGRQPVNLEHLIKVLKFCHSNFKQQVG